MKRVVITGATSMLGIALIKECIKNDIKVLAIVRRQSANLSRLPKSALIEVCECGLEELESVAARDKEYDVFYHFAWDYTSKATRDNPSLQERNIKYTMDAVDAAKRLGCSKFIGAGSQAEYGKVDALITADTPTAPVISYGIAKYAAGKLSEKLCTEYGMIHIWGRVFSVYGRYDNAGTMLSYAIEQFMKKEPARFSTATQPWDYLHEDDAGKIFYLLGEKIQENRVYRVASGKTRILKEYILELKRLFGQDAVCCFASETESLGNLGLQVDIGDLVEDIGYEPMISFEEGVLDMIKYRKQTFIGGYKNNLN